jgi:hypothetical protein
MALRNKTNARRHFVNFSRRITTAAAMIRVQVTFCGTCCGQSDIAAGFLRVLRFPLPFLIPQLLYVHNNPSSGADTIGQLVGNVPSGLSLTPSHEKKKHASMLLSAISTVHSLEVNNSFFYWCMHPAALCITSNNLTVNATIYFYLFTHYMFRPQRVIFRFLFTDVQIALDDAHFTIACLKLL